VAAPVSFKRKTHDKTTCPTQHSSDSSICICRNTSCHIGMLLRTTYHVREHASHNQAGCAAFAICLCQAVHGVRPAGCSAFAICLCQAVHGVRPAGCAAFAICLCQAVHGVRPAGCAAFAICLCQAVHGVRPAGCAAARYAVRCMHACLSHDPRIDGTAYMLHHIVYVYKHAKLCSRCRASTVTLTWTPAVHLQLRRQYPCRS
jgi:hypothetical protein